MSLDGDRTAFQSLMESQQSFAYALAFRLLRDEENAKDIVQEAFIRAWKHLGRYRPEVKFTTWLYKIVVNLCYDRLKVDTRRRNVFGVFGARFDQADIPDRRELQEEVEHTDLCNHILRFAKRLPPKENLVFHLRDVLDFSIEEIAEIAGISVGSVKTNLCYARKRIRIAVTRMQEREGQ